MGQVLFEHLFSFLRGIYPGIELLGDMGVLCSTLSGTTKLFAAAAVPFSIPPANSESSKILFLSPNKIPVSKILDLPTSNSIFGSQQI